MTKIDRCFNLGSLERQLGNIKLAKKLYQNPVILRVAQGVLIWVFRGKSGDIKLAKPHQNPVILKITVDVKCGHLENLGISNLRKLYQKS